MLRYGLFYYHRRMDVKNTQLKVLERLLRSGTNTAYANHVGISSGLSYERFKLNAPVCTYDTIKPWVDRCKSGEPDVLWPGRVHHFAVSAGTTGKGKHIPIYADRISSDLGFMRSVMRHIISVNPDPGLFLGKHVALSGSVETVDGLHFGEISGILACASPRWIRLWHILCPEKAATMAWSIRYKTLVDLASRSDIRVLTGVPSWILIFLRDVSSRTGMPIEQVWPNLKLVVTGGVALSVYHQAIRYELGTLNVRFLENYGASEGYFAFDWFDAGSMLLQYNSDVFYEFIPIDIGYEKAKHSLMSAGNITPLWEVQPYVRYALVVTNIGLMRYLTNDEVIFESIDPPRLKILGRLNEMTDTFGEAVNATEVHSVVKQVMPSITYDHLHIRPTWNGNPALPFHEWIFVIADPYLRNSMIESSTTLPNELDQHLRLINRHYAIRRETGAMRLPSLRIIGMDEYETIIRAQPRSQSKLGMFI